MEELELYHHGVLGMKWGIRRNRKGGSGNSSSGKKGKSSESDASDAPGGKQKSGPKGKSSSSPKKIHDMDDDELKSTINRLQLEKQAYELRNQVAALNPKQVSAGKKFVQGAIKDVIAPAAKNAGKAYLEKILKDKLGLKDTDSLDALQKEVKGLNLTKQKKELEKYFASEKEAAEAAKKSKASSDKDGSSPKTDSDGGSKGSHATDNKRDNDSGTTAYKNSEKSNDAKNATPKSKGEPIILDADDYKVNESDVSVGKEYLRKLLE